MSRQKEQSRARVRNAANSRDSQVFNSAADSAIPGVQMAVLLHAAAPDTGKPLGTAECEVSPKLTHDDLRQLEGHGEGLVGKLQERYGLAKEEAERQANEFRSHYNWN